MQLSTSMQLKKSPYIHFLLPDWFRYYDPSDRF